MKKILAIIAIVSCVPCNLLAERFLNVSSKKMKVKILNAKTKDKIKEFDLKPLQPEFVDIESTHGIIVHLKQIKSSYLLEKKQSTVMCDDCGKKIETVCGCKNKQAKKESKEQEAQLELSPAEMNRQNEFIILGTNEELKIKVISPKPSREGRFNKNKDNK